MVVQANQYAQRWRPRLGVRIGKLGFGRTPNLPVERTAQSLLRGL